MRGLRGGCSNFAIFGFFFEGLSFWRGRCTGMVNCRTPLRGTFGNRSHMREHGAKHMGRRKFYEKVRTHCINDFNEPLEK